MASIGYIIFTGLDVSRKSKNKSLLLFKRTNPNSTAFFSLSLGGTDKIRLVNAPRDVTEVIYDQLRIEILIWILRWKISSKAIIERKFRFLRSMKDIDQWKILIFSCLSSSEGNNTFQVYSIWHYSFLLKSHFRHGCSPVTSFPRNTSGWLLLLIDV